MKNLKGVIYWPIRYKAIGSINKHAHNAYHRDRYERVHGTVRGRVGLDRYDLVREFVREQIDGRLLLNEKRGT